MKYLMLVCEDPTAEPYRREDDDIATWVDQTQDVRVIGERLRPVAEARTVRVRGGRLSVVEGPYAEVGEQIAGFDVLECDSLDQAVEVASRHPMARFGRLVVREAWPFEDGELLGD
ncbi:YciI family protein [Cellulomonas persica]|uniref:Transcription initiation protein n=1 Tax=Cellulomonas persica TaxID=76861 RepID=A0A510UP34_9CELL|nr:YciI family protein [Cellulomonas persica]GEK16427.1 transcription initiation protein [Cellulomonas persica]